MNGMLVALAGWAHFGMIGVGLTVPRVFDWKTDLARLRPANRRIFHVYGIFIVLANIGFGSLSLAFDAEIAEGRGLAGGFALMLGLYWLARLAVQLFAYDTPDWPREPVHRIGHHFLTAVITGMALVYLWAFAGGLVG